MQNAQDGGLCLCDISTTIVVLSDDRQAHNINLEILSNTTAIHTSHRFPVHYLPTIHGSKVQKATARRPRQLSLGITPTTIVDKRAIILISPHGLLDR